MIDPFERLDSIDKYILDLLGKDGRLSGSQISKYLTDNRMKMTERGIVKRLKRLEEKNIIIGYSTIVNPIILAKKTCRVLFLKFKDSLSTTEGVNKLNRYIEESSFCLSAAILPEGDFDYICEFVFESQRQFAIESNNFLYTFKDLISEYHIYESKIIKSRNYRIFYDPALEERRARAFKTVFLHKKPDNSKHNLQVIVESIVKDFEVKFAGIWLQDKANKNLILKFTAGVLGSLSEISIECGRIVGQILKTKKPFSMYDLAEAQKIHGGHYDWAKRENLKSFGGYPLIQGDQVMGVLAVFSERKFALADFDILESFLHTVFNNAIITN